jgi:hypothetical protein
MNDLERFRNPNYTASNEDVLHIRTVTQTVAEHLFQVHQKTFHIFDVSGLKNHRKHWISYFTDVPAILFVSSLACYDQWMVEEKQTNRMLDAIKVTRISYYVDF